MQLILGSASPRRQEILHQAGFQFEVRISDVEESFPLDLDPEKVAQFLAEKKALAIPMLNPEEVILTADTTVIIENEILGKPQSPKEAESMLLRLSGKVHKVITGCCIKHQNTLNSFSSITKVYFKPLSLDQIRHYIINFQPFDKAGAYGIQEWIGMIGIEKIEGCYYNVVGLPISKVYQEINQLKDSILRK